MDMSPRKPIGKKAETEMVTIPRKVLLQMEEEIEDLESINYYLRHKDTKKVVPFKREDYL